MRKRRERGYSFGLGRGKIQLMSGDCLAQLINDRFDQQNSDRKHLLVINVSGKRSPLPP
jgi:hypothetical protein